MTGQSLLFVDDDGSNLSVMGSNEAIGRVQDIIAENKRLWRVAEVAQEIADCFHIESIQGNKLLTVDNIGIELAERLRHALIVLNLDAWIVGSDSPEKRKSGKAS